MPALPLPAQSGNLLSNYVFELRRLLHDPNDKMYSYADKVIYVNKGRERVARDTLCCRLLQTGLTLAAGTEKYTWSTFLTYGAQTVDVLGVSVYWGNLKYQLDFWTYAKLDQWLRTWNTFRQRPVVFARYGGAYVYVGPVPDQNYTSDWDTAVIPDALVDDTSAETIPIPFQQAVAFYAAYFAKQYEQSFGDAALMLKQYEQMRGNAQGTWRRMMNDAHYR